MRGKPVLWKSLQQKHVNNSAHTAMDSAAASEPTLEFGGDSWQWSGHDGQPRSPGSDSTSDVGQPDLSIAPHMESLSQISNSTTVISDADNEQVSYRVNFQGLSEEFSVREAPISEEERMALLINKSVEQVPFNIQFKHIGKSLQFDTSVHQTVMDWEQERDPRTITNFERREMLKKRKMRDRASSQLGHLLNVQLNILTTFTDKYTYWEGNGPC